MGYPYLLQFKPGVSLIKEDSGLRITGPLGRYSRLANPHPAQRWMLEQLVRGGMSADAICTVATSHDPSIDQARLFYLLAKLEKQHFLAFTLVDVDGRPLATVEPLDPEFALRDLDATAGTAWRLSRFAAASRVGDRMVMSSPLGHAQIVLQGSALAFTGSLARAHTLSAWAALPSMPAMDVCAGLLGVLVNAGMVFACDAEDMIPEDRHPSLQQWEAHDLHFHYRSRWGNHDLPIGATYRFDGHFDSLPACKAPMSAQPIVLQRPDMDLLAKNDPPFSQVSEARRSVRQPGASPITLAALGDFLCRSVGMRKMLLPAGQSPYEASLRPVASGGAMHDLEIYVFVNRCKGLDAGLYHYDAVHHRLEPLPVAQALCHRMFSSAMAGSATSEPSDVLLVMAARFRRLNWKYEGMAHATRLKNVGALYQQMYLVATAMNLAPCGLGAGDSRLFAEVTGLDIHTEGSVGEFMLSGR